LLALLTLPLAVAGFFRSRGAFRTSQLILFLVLGVGVAPFIGPLLVSTFRGVAHLLGAEIGSGVLFDGRGYLAYPGSLLSVIAELKPLLTPFGLASIAGAGQDLSPGLFLLPVALLFWARSLRDQIRSTHRNLRITARSLLLIFGSALLLMTLSQRRNIYYLGIFTAIALAEGVGRLSGRFRIRRDAVPLVLTASLVLVCGIGPLRAMAAYRDGPGTDFFLLLQRFAAAAPTGIDPAALPAPSPGAIEGIFGPWAAGHYITALTGRPAAADPNGYGWIRQSRLFTSESDVEAESILRQARCRFLLTANLRGVLADYAQAADRPSTSTFDRMFGIRIHESLSKRPVPFLELFLESRTAYREPGGRIVPVFRIWKVTSPVPEEGGSTPAPAAPAGAQGG
jgi:hypothetical protein